MHFKGKMKIKTIYYLIQSESHNRCAGPKACDQTCDNTVRTYVYYHCAANQHAWVLWDYHHEHIYGLQPHNKTPMRHISICKQLAEPPFGCRYTICSSDVECGIYTYICGRLMWLRVSKHIVYYAMHALPDFIK